MSEALSQLHALADPERAHEMRAYHKTDREVLGVGNPKIDEIVKGLRASPEVDLEIADELWQSGVFEARIAAGKLLTRGKLSPEMDKKYWQTILGLAPDFDGWAIADAMASAAHKRVLLKVGRYGELAEWTGAAHLWTKRAALVYTLPFARLKAPGAAELEAIETILTWAAGYTEDSEWFIQKSVGWWLRELSKRNPVRVENFLEQYGAGMKPFARREAAKYL